jgi:O-antigen/teichoic acid export membrane protein
MSMTLGIDPNTEVAIDELPRVERLATRVLARFAGPMAYRGAISIADQVLVSGTNFLTAVIVGRACGPHELGDYTLGFTLFVLAVCVQRALISMPFTLHLYYFEGDRQRAYAGSTLAHLLALGLATMLVLGLGTLTLAMGFGPANLVPLAGVLALVFPLAFLVEFARRFALARLEMMTVLVVDVAVTVLQIGGLLTLASLGMLSAVGAYIAVGVAAAVTGVTWLWVARAEFLFHPARIAADAARNWRYGRWLLVGQVTLTGRSYSLIWLVALLMDTTTTGIFVACDTLVRLWSPLPLAVANILFPSASRAFAKGDTAEVRRMVNHSTLLLIAASLPFSAFLALLGDLVVTTLYGNEYSGYGLVMGMLGMTAVADSIDTGAANGLFAIHRPNVHVIANLLGTVVILLVAATLIPEWGLVGAAAGSVTGRVVTSTMQYALFLRLTRGARVEELS